MRKPNEALVPPDGSEASVATQRLLIVEDDAEMRSLLAKALAGEQRQILQAADGTEAIAWLQNPEALLDLVISDIRMPHHDGHAVLRAAREFSPETRVILITAFGEIDEYLDTMDRGAFEYLTKPVRLADLVQVVERALERKTAA